MATEVERRFFLESLPPDLAIPRPHLAVQAYENIIAEQALEQRIRLWQAPNGTVSFKRTVKQGRGLSRTEDQQPITVQDFFSAFQRILGRPIVKHVYEFPIGADLIAGVQRSLSHEPLVIVEVEFTSPEAAAAFVPPDWFGEEVTNDPMYNSQSIALHGVPSDYLAPPAEVIQRLTAVLPSAASQSLHENGC